MSMSGKYCSPKRSHDNKKDGSVTCYTKKQLTELATAYNKQYSHKISLTGSKAELWKAINDRMNECTNEWCWSDQLKYKEGMSSFRPIRPVGKNAWLSTTDIRDVLQQYQELYSDFMAIGPVPIDFCYLGHTLCKMDVLGAYRKGTRTIGAVFNTDPSSEPGKHWISMFIDMRHPDPRYWEINYFDSFGNAPLAKEIIALVKHVDGQFAKAISERHNIDRSKVKVIKKLNCSQSMCTHKVQHQFNNTECGVYSIHFIVKRLEGRTWEELVTERATIMNDEYMTNMRKFYFRPSVGNQHRY